ncbi:BRCT domain-containing protein (plasmid) [Cytobacillus oceanisediminis]|uniref:BRCT domain-containing protein n=1 Tax=Cytobacillus oceanisediminis TaxID=665099 RepID=UPI001863F7E1|nr:BRCT domain-containing protein [Cytobacillus oceanisediminis]QOK30074.1 BRCT domain-containing protein [Cytobacillus oceanisediminis]
MGKTQLLTLHPLKGEVFVFSGKMHTLLRKEAIKEVFIRGGICEENVTKNTTYLVIGLENPEAIKRNVSTKLGKAEEYNAAGISIKIITEEEFLNLLR